MTEPKTRTEIRLAGFGGQGVVLAGVLLGQAAVNDGQFAAGSNSYGSQARGSACKAEVVVSRKPIDYPHVEHADLFVALSQGGYDAFKDQIAEDGEIFYDSGLVANLDAERPGQGFEITAIAVEDLGNKQVANVIWVGLVAGITGWFSRNALEKAAEQHVPGRFLELNLKALARGFSLAP